MKVFDIAGYLKGDVRDIVADIWIREAELGELRQAVRLLGAFIAAPEASDFGRALARDLRLKISAARGIRF